MSKGREGLILIRILAVLNLAPSLPTVAVFSRKLRVVIWIRYIIKAGQALGWRTHSLGNIYK